MSCRIDLPPDANSLLSVIGSLFAQPQLLKVKIAGKQTGVAVAGPPGQKLTLLFARGASAQTLRFTV